MLQSGKKWSMILSMIKNVIIAVIILVVLGAGAYLLLSQNKQATPVAQPSVTQEVTPTAATTSATTPSAQEARITLQADGFFPATVTIKAGTKVIWTNNSGTTGDVNSDPHPIHTDYPPLNLGTFANNSSVSLVFDKPGTYGYHNHLNPGQRGTIIVQ